MVNHNPDVLDIIILKNFGQSVELETLAELTSDHNPVMLKIGDETEVYEKTPRYNFRKADWQCYQDKLSRMTEPGPLSTGKEIDEAVDHFTATIQKAIEDSIPKQTPPRCSIYDLPEGIKQSIAEKNRARRQWQKNRTPDLLKRYNALTRLLKEQIQQHRGEKWEAAVSKLKEADNSIWRMTRRLTGRKEASPPLQGRTHLACTNKDKAEVLADTLEESFTPNAASMQSHRINQEVARHLEAHPPQAEEGSAEECTQEEVLKLTKSLANGKAPGQDGITNQAIKMLPPQAVAHLVKIFSACLRLQHFPKPWKEAKVIVFAKPGKPLRDPANYRPISLLSGLSKLLEKLILARLTQHTTARNLLSNVQFGFRKEHSTTHQLLRVVDTISHGFNIHKSTGIVFLDVSKAFDRVWHTGLLHKLVAMDFPNHLVNPLSSYLGGRTFHVSVKEERSTSRPICAGVPQGSIIGPFLFNLFTNDIPKDLRKTDLALYADDVAVISQSFSEKEVAKNLQTSLDRLSGWYDDWQMALNSTKTTATMFTRKVKTVHPEIRLNGEVIKWEPTSNYLGLTLDSKNNWRSHLEKTQQKASGKLAALYPLLKTKTMPLKSKVRIIKAIIRPTLTYAAPVWSGCHPSYRNQLQKVQNKALRIAAGAPPWTRTTDLHRELGIEMLDEYLLKLNQKFYSELDQNTNPLVKKLATISVNPFDKYPRPTTALHL